MKRKTMLALTAAGLTMAAANSQQENYALTSMTKKEHKAWFIKNKTDEFVKAGHSRPFARTLARIAYQNSLRK